MARHLLEKGNEFYFFLCMSSASSLCILIIPKKNEEENMYEKYENLMQGKKIIV